jgi:hypothetical protein
MFMHNFRMARPAHPAPAAKQLPPHELLSAAQAAKALGLTHVWVCRLCAQGRLGWRVGNSWVISRREVRNYLRCRRPPGRPRRARRRAVPRNSQETPGKSG